MKTCRARRAQEGANDNGSGVSALLELTRLLGNLRGRSPFRVRLVFFVNEEPPYAHGELKGSFVYAKALKRSGEPVLGMISLETIGFFSDAENSQNYPFPLGLLYPSTGNFVAFVRMVSSRAFVRRTVEAFRDLVPFPSVGGTAPAFIPGIDWSDHWSFEQVGIPALMVTRRPTATRRTTQPRTRPTRSTMTSSQGSPLALLPLSRPGQMPRYLAELRVRARSAGGGVESDRHRTVVHRGDLHLKLPVTTTAPPRTGR